MIQRPDYPAINTTIIEIYNYYFLIMLSLLLLILILVVRWQSNILPLTLKPKLSAFINTRAIMLHV